MEADPLPRLLAIYRPLLLGLVTACVLFVGRTLVVVNWKGDEQQWLTGPSTGPPRQIPWGGPWQGVHSMPRPSDLRNRMQGWVGVPVPWHYLWFIGPQPRLEGTNVRLRHSYVVCCEAFERDGDGNETQLQRARSRLWWQVAKILARCNYQSLGVPTALDGVGQGPKVVQLGSHFECLFNARRL